MPGQFLFDDDYAFAVLPYPTAILLEAARAAERANALLLAYLSAQQRKTWARGGFFDVCARSGNVYRITNRGISHNVYGPVNNVEATTRVLPLQSFCVHLPGGDGPCGYPMADHWLAQAMSILTDERNFLALASFPYYPPYYLR